MSNEYAFGIEEEYFLVDAGSKAVAATRPDGFFHAAKAALGNQITGEMLQAQIEVATQPQESVAAARDELRQLRRITAAIAKEHGLAILASGTHPTALWLDQIQTPAERYDAVMHDLQMIGQRNMLCGLHVHVELPSHEARVDVMTRMLPYLPLFIALATSSPFWQSKRTGLMGYRLAAYDELPRTGIPELFRTAQEFDAYVDALVKAGVIEDSSYVWWAMRPSLQHPTLELRAPDCCTFVDDAVAIASLYRALVRRLHRNPQINATLTAVSRAIVVENKWRAQRYGVHGTFVDEDNGCAVTVAELVERVIAESSADAEALGCRPEVEHCRAIVTAGTSADAQLAVFNAVRNQHGDREQALAAVTSWIAEATLQ